MFYGTGSGEGMSEDTLLRAISRELNSRSRENISNTPDFILAKFLEDSLRAFEEATNTRNDWYQSDKEKLQKALEHNKIMREALEFYAEKENWVSIEYNEYFGEDDIIKCEAKTIDSSYVTARIALKKVQDNN